LKREDDDRYDPRERILDGLSSRPRYVLRKPGAHGHAAKTAVDGHRRRDSLREAGRRALAAGAHLRRRRGADRLPAAACRVDVGGEARACPGPPPSSGWPLCLPPPIV